MTAAMSPETRVLIVRRLREEAARLEAGGEPRECVARGASVDGCNGKDVRGARVSARDAITREREEATGAEWSGEVDGVYWGVVVPVEQARVVSRMCPSGTNPSADEVWDYGLVDAGAPETEPPLDPCEDDDCQTCHPWCEICKVDLVDGACPACRDEDHAQAGPQEAAMTLGSEP